MILILDNFDSFTYNLFQLVSGLGRDCRVKRPDETTLEDIRDMHPTHLIISPGPGRPESATLSCEIIREFGATTPILGVCLGMQCMAIVLGAAVVPGAMPVHGKTDIVHHDGLGIFRDVRSPLSVVRYHSLVVDPASVMGDLVVSARTESGIIMGLRHRDRPVEGVQFHPESILTENSNTLVSNFLRIGCTSSL